MKLDAGAVCISISFCLFRSRSVFNFAIRHTRVKEKEPSPLSLTDYVDYIVFFVCALICDSISILLLQKVSHQQQCFLGLFIRFTMVYTDRLCLESIFFPL